MAEEKDPKYELLERFRADLKRPISERYYSEDELLQVFDYAGDAYDEYLRAEALLLGMRLYPDSAELLARRAIFYRDYDSEAFRNFLDDNATESDSIMKLMRLSNSGLEGDEAVKALDDFLLTNSLGEDEEVIRFVQTVHDLGADQWLVDNLQKVRGKVEYLPSLLYEIAMLSNESEPFEKISVEVLEELTEMEPYAPEYWTLLSIVYSRQQRYADARQAVEYALAIQPDYPEALKAKLRTYAEDSESKEIEPLLDALGKAVPDDPEIAYMRVAHLEEHAKPEEVNAFIDSLTPEARVSQIMVMKAIQYDNSHLEEMLAPLYDSGVTDGRVWRDIAEFAFINNNIQALMKVIDAYQNLSGYEMDHSFIDMRVLFALKRYDDGLQLFTEAGTDTELRQPARMMECYAMYLLMLLRTDRFAEAEGAAEAMVTMIDNEPAVPGTPVEKYGMRNFAKDILKRLKSIRKTNWHKYDPLGLDR